MRWFSKKSRVSRLHRGRAKMDGVKRWCCYKLVRLMSIYHLEKFFFFFYKKLSQFSVIGNCNDCKFVDTCWLSRIKVPTSSPPTSTPPILELSEKTPHTDNLCVQTWECRLNKHADWVRMYIWCGFWLGADVHWVRIVRCTIYVN